MSVTRPFGQIIRRAFESQMTMKLMSRLGLSEGAARTKAQLMVQSNREELIRISRMARLTGELDASLAVGALTDDLARDASAPVAMRGARRPNQN